MKHVMFVIVVIVMILILLKLMLWTLKNVIACAVIVAILYFLVQIFSSKKKTS